MKTISQILLQNISSIIVSGFILSACSWSSRPSDQGQNVVDVKQGENVSMNITPEDSKSLQRSHFLTIADAEKILGEPVHLIDSSTTLESDGLMFQCGYAADEMDIKTRKTGAVYFLTQAYPDLPGAQKRYSFIMESNKDHGIQELKDLGDEAYFHTDGENFYFIMVRKGVNVFNMKVNKITSKTSLEAFNDIARQITKVL